MKIKKKLLLFKTIFVLPLLTLISCASNNYDKFKNYIDPKKDIIDASLNSEVAQTKQIIKELLNKIFTNNQVAKTNFELKQNNLKYQKNFFNEIKNLQKSQKEKYKETNIKQYIKKLQDLYSKNWYIVLNNLNKFELSFYKWYVLPKQKDLYNDKEVSMSDQYLEKIKTLTPYNKYKFQNNNLNQIKENEHSGENSSFADLLILKDKMLINIILEMNKQTNVIFKPYVYFFPKSKSKISINLISNIFHQAVIHRSKKHYDIFEKDVIEKQRYGEPALMLINLSSN